MKKLIDKFLFKLGYVQLRELTYLKTTATTANGETHSVDFAIPVRVSHELTQLDIERSKFYPEKYFHDMLSAKMTEALRPHIKFYGQENSAGATIASAEVCVLKK